MQSNKDAKPFKIGFILNRLIESMIGSAKEAYMMDSAVRIRSGVECTLFTLESVMFEVERSEQGPLDRSEGIIIAREHKNTVQDDWN